MKPSRVQSGVALLVFACVVALHMSPGLKAGGPGIQNKPSRTLDSDKGMRHRHACPWRAELLHDH